ncbi:hypothetical protein GCM10023075_52120 [Streptosporangium album]
MGVDDDAVVPDEFQLSRVLAVHLRLEEIATGRECDVNLHGASSIGAAGRRRIDQPISCDVHSRKTYEMSRRPRCGVPTDDHVVAISRTSGSKTPGPAAPRPSPKESQKVFEGSVN